MNHINNKEVQTFELTDKNNLENFTKEEHALYKKNKRELGNLFDNVKKSFLKISLQLYPIYTKKLYRIDNYHTSTLIYTSLLRIILRFQRVHAVNF